MKKVLIITGSTDEYRTPSSSEDSLMEEVLDVTLPSKQRYAKKHGYDILTLRSFGEDPRGIFEKSEIGYQRVIVTIKMLESYDTVMWLDADSIITNDKISITDFCIDDSHTFYASYDWDGKKSFSCGNFIFNKTKHLDEFVKMFWYIGSVLPRSTREEQQTLNIMYTHTNMRNTCKILEHKFLGSTPPLRMVSKYINPFIRPIVGEWTEESFLAHLTGVCNRSRLEILKDNFSKYL